MRLFIYLTLLSLFQIGCGNKNASKPTGNPVVLAVNYSKGDSKNFPGQNGSRNGDEACWSGSASRIEFYF